MTYTMKVAGLERQLPLCKVADNFYIGAFIIFGDAELTVACAAELLKKIPAGSYDYMLTAEAKSIPLIHEMARQSGAKKYFIARKGSKVYMPNPIHVSVRSITTLRQQDLFLGADECEAIRGKRILLCHGHTYGVKSSLVTAGFAAEERQLDLFLFGHTHRPLVDRRGRTLFLNPGSIGASSRPSYGVVTIRDGQLDGRTVWLT